LRPSEDDRLGVVPVFLAFALLLPVVH
jgi:hypothetical protein